MAVLYFTPRTPIDADLMGQMLVDSGFHAEWDVREGRYQFEEEKETIDVLETELQSMMDSHGVFGYFEGE
jgi:hypothetical protein